MMIFQELAVRSTDVRYGVQALAATQPSPGIYRKECAKIQYVVPTVWVAIIGLGLKKYRA